MGSERWPSRILSSNRGGLAERATKRAVLSMTAVQRMSCEAGLDTIEVMLTFYLWGRKNKTACKTHRTVPRHPMHVIINGDVAIEMSTVHQRLRICSNSSFGHVGGRQVVNIFPR